MKQIDEINKPRNEELFNNIHKQYQEFAKIKTKDEQIEEMAIENLVALLWHNTNMYDEELIIDVAVALVNAGYRKQSEVAREIFADIEKYTYRYLNDADYSGGDLIYDIAELKKKYTEG